MTFTNRRLGRRTLLRGTGVALALPFLDAMVRARPARAAVAPKRFVLFYTPNGTNDPKQFYPQGTGSTYTLGKESAPLEPLRKRLLPITGINMVSARDDGGDLHSVGMAHMLTGTRFVRADGYARPGGNDFYVGFGGGISVDQEIAKHVGAQTRFPSLELGVQSVVGIGAHPFSRMIYAGKNRPLPAEDDPRAAFKRLFGDGAVTSAAEIERALVQRKSVLDFALEDYQRLAASLGAGDRAKIDQHMTLLREVEQRLDGPRAAPALCPGAAAVDPAKVTKPLEHAQFAEVGKLQMKILTLALSCDLTRVASLQWSWARSTISHPWAGVSDGHHNMSHGGASAKLSDINRWYAQQLATLATDLEAIDEGGRSLLDSSVVYWCGECALGANHSFDNVRVFLLGSGGGFFKTGEAVRFNGEPHNKLMVTLLRSMGVEANEFGDPKYGKGPLPGLTA